MSERVAVVAGARTPFVKAGTHFKARRSLDLAIHSVDGLLERYDVAPHEIEALTFGVVGVDPRAPHLAREVTFGSSLPVDVRSVTVTDNCITGITAIEHVADAIRAERIEVGMAGGVESMSNPPLMARSRASRAFLAANRAKGFGGRLRALARLRPRDLVPTPPGVEEPSTGLSMGQHTELMVDEWAIPRTEQDEIAVRSHHHAAAATADGRLGEEIIPLDGIDGDTIVRPDTSMEALAALPPAFDLGPSGLEGPGTLTAGNSSPLTDGSSAVLLMSESRAKKEGREPLAFIRAIEFASIDPSDGLLMGPGVAVPRLLARTGIELDDFGLIEMHEAFGGQVAANLAAWELGWKEGPIGKVDMSRLNQLGGSIAIGHPFAATGLRIVTQLANEMARRDVRLGLISICGAGATAAAVVLERG